MLISVKNRRAARQGRKNKLPTILRFETLESRSMMAVTTGFVVTSLASDLKGVAAHRDADLINPWGFVQSSSGDFRIGANGAGNAPLLSPGGHEQHQAIVLPAPSDSPSGSTGAATGAVANSTTGFVISHGHRSGPASVIFSTEDGTIIGINSHVDSSQGVIGADLSDSGAVFKGLAIGASTGNTFLYATDFHNGTIDVFDKNFNQVNLAGSFTDPNAPPPAIGSPGFAPFGIQNVGGTLFVTYALQDSDQHDDVAGQGNGFIDEFDTSGNFIKRFATGSAIAGGTVAALNSPWGLAVAPSGYGPNGVFGGALLVGNFGDSHVSAFNIQTGAFIGQLSGPAGNPLTLNGGVGGSDTKGLWGIGFGNGHGGASKNTLFFTAGINGESDGLFGKVTATTSHNTSHSATVFAAAALPSVMSAPSGGSTSTSTVTTAASSKPALGPMATLIAANAEAPPSLHLGARNLPLIDQMLADSNLDFMLL